MMQWFDHHSWAIYLIGSVLTLVLTVWGIVLWRSGETRESEFQRDDTGAVEPFTPQHVETAERRELEKRVDSLKHRR